MPRLTTFQLVLLLGFVIAALVGAVLFALGPQSSVNEEIGTITIWGTLDKSAMNLVLADLAQEDDRFNSVYYEEKDSRTYNQEFVNALASGSGPDLFLLSEANILGNRDKLLTVPYDSYSERLFKDTFIEAGELYLAAEGIYGLPLTIDPLVMYWNRDIFADVSVSEPPRYWDEFFTLAAIVTQRDASSNIRRSLAGLGEYRNVVHAKDILSALMIQTGNPIIFRAEDGRLEPVLSNTFNYATPPAQAALRFYTEFSNPTKAVYSWNRSLHDSRQSFIAGDVALYFGYASEYQALKRANPNLNFDVAAFPQTRDSNRLTTFGHLTALAVAKWSPNPQGAFLTAVALTSSPRVAQLGSLTGLPPVRRDLLRTLPSDPAGAVFYKGAIAARSWLDPQPSSTEGVFQRMIESILSGRALIDTAVQTAEQELRLLLQ